MKSGCLQLAFSTQSDCWDSSLLFCVVYIMNVVKCSINEWKNVVQDTVVDFTLCLPPNALPILLHYGHCVLSGSFANESSASGNILLPDSWCTHANFSLGHKICAKEQDHGVGSPSVLLPNARLLWCYTSVHSHQLNMKARLS